MLVIITKCLHLSSNELSNRHVAFPFILEDEVCLNRAFELWILAGLASVSWFFFSTALLIDGYEQKEPMQQLYL